MILFPRLQLIELEDLPWFPSWIREYAHLLLAQVWRTKGLGKSTTTASQACDILLEQLQLHQHPESDGEDISSFIFVDACAGAGGPTPILEKTLNSKLHSQGRQPVRFVLADLYPHLDAWRQIVKRSDYISYIERPVDATRTVKYLPDAEGRRKKECRMFNLSFHHFDDESARKVLRSAVRGADTFVIFELTHRTLSALLNTTIVVLGTLLTTLLWFWHSPVHMVFTYIIPIIPLFFAWDGYVSCIRGRTERELRELIYNDRRHDSGRQANGVDDDEVDLSEWEFRSGEKLVLPPFGYLYWFVGVKRESR